MVLELCQSISIGKYWHFCGICIGKILPILFKIIKNSVVFYNKKDSDEYFS